MGPRGLAVGPEAALPVEIAAGDRVLDAPDAAVQALELSLQALETAGPGRGPGLVELALAGVGRAFQLTNLFPRLTVLENVRLAVQARRLGGGRLLSRASADRDTIAEAMRYVERTRLAAVAGLPAAALPPEDPPGTRSRFQGLWVGP